MINYRETSAALFIRHVIEYLDSRYENQKDIKGVPDCQSPISGAEKQVAAFTSSLLMQICKGVYSQERESVISMVSEEIHDTVTDLLDEQEAKEFIDFAYSSTGKKIFRNMDLFRDTYACGVNYLQAETIKAWDSPIVAGMIRDYIDKITSNDRDVNEDDETGWSKSA